MAQDPPASPTAEPKDAPLWPTAVGLTALVLGCVFFVRSIESSLIVRALGLFSMGVTIVGVLFHGVQGLWSLTRGRRPAARGRLVRAVMYLVFGVASFAVVRSQGGTVEEFRSGLEPGMSVHEALRRLDILYTAHPAKYRLIALSGTSSELALDDYRKIEQPGEGSVIFTWNSGEAHSTGVVADTAAVLAKSRQVWFTFRGDASFVHFFVILDDRGLIKSISGTTRHQV